MGVFLTGLTFVSVFKNICKCRFKKKNIITVKTIAQILKSKSNLYPNDYDLLLI